MDCFNLEGEGTKKVTEVKIFPVPLSLNQNQENIVINTKNASNPSKEKLINRAFKYHSQGNISDAEKYYQNFINQGFEDHIVFSNYGLLLKNLGKLKEAENLIRKAIKLSPNYSIAHYNLGIILKDLGKLKEAEKSTRKAIELSPNYAIAYYNLAIILKDIGKLNEAEISIIKAIELNPNYAKSYFLLSLLRYSDKSKICREQLFSENILNKKSQKDLIDIYFARANFLHEEKKYEDSSRYIKLANKLKLDTNQYKLNYIYNKSKELLIKSDQKEINKNEIRKSFEFLFIVGMPRSGSTLLESILSMSKDVCSLGEINILEESFLECKMSNKYINLSEIYEEKVNSKTELNITTNKWLFNYQYAGIIASQIPNAKIIHCFRHPLDNILSIYRAHFAQGNEYSSSLIDSANVYIHQDEIMTEYKNRYRPKIYDFNYDLLVSDPNKEIKFLISWLGWKWDNAFLSPHLNQRSVSTASSIQVRSPINPKSIGGWKNYKDMLKPAIEILIQTEKYKDIAS